MAQISSSVASRFVFIVNVDELAHAWHSVRFGLCYVVVEFHMNKNSAAKTPQIADTPGLNCPVTSIGD